MRKNTLASGVMAGYLTVSANHWSCADAIARAARPAFRATSNDGTRPLFDPALWAGMFEGAACVACLPLCDDLLIALNAAP